MDNASAREWGRQRSLMLDSTRRILFTAPDSRADCVRVRIPRDFTRLAFLAYYLLRLLHTEEAEYGGSLLWIEQFDIEDAPINRVAGRIWARLAISYGQAEALPSAAAYVFDSSELLDASAFLLLALGFQWDAYLVPAVADYVVYKHHDDVLYIVPRLASLTEQLLRDLEAGGWEPQRQDCLWFVRPVG